MSPQPGGPGQISDLIAVGLGAAVPDRAGQRQPRRGRRLPGRQAHLLDRIAVARRPRLGQP